mgnify:CR=1 FL=1
MKMGSSLVKGESGLSVYNDTVEAGGQAMGVWAEKIPFVGNALSKASKAAAKAVVLINKQADTLFKTYKDLSSIGAAGEGLQETFKNLQTIGLATTDIDQFTAALKKADKDLLYFGYSMADGAKGFSQAVGGIYKGPLGRDLETLGYQFEDISSATATYITLQGRLGRLQMKTQEDLMKETHAYALELDLLARLTGQSREEQQKEQRALIEIGRAHV